jgi:hypothetical protein
MPTSSGWAAAPSRADGATAIRVYATNGDLRFTTLAEHVLTAVSVTARYAYVDTNGGRFSVDLHSGATTGPLSSRAPLVVPDLLRLP